MANNRYLTGPQQHEVLRALGPVVERYALRFDVPSSAVLDFVGANVYDRPTKATLASDWLPTQRDMKLLVRTASDYTLLCSAAIVEDNTPAASEARDAVIYVARSRLDIDWSIIESAFPTLDHDSVFDSFCRAIGAVENQNRDFARIVDRLVRVAKGKVR